MWKKLRYKSLLAILFVFLLIGGLLFAERSGIKYEFQNAAVSFLKTEVITAEEAMESLEPECLMLMDSSSESSREAVAHFQQIFKDMKVGYTLIDAATETVPDYSNYQTVAVLITDLTLLDEEVLELCRWVENGGRVLFALTLEKSAYTGLIEQKMGIISSDYVNIDINAIYFDADFIIGGGRSYVITDPFDSAWSVEVGESVKVHAWTDDDREMPLIWENAYGQGKFVVDNFGLYEKATRGFYAASYSLLADVCVYPVINASVFYIDDFPSPVPAGDGAYVKRDYGVNISNFYTNIWWPELLALAEEYGVRFTGVIIENYSDDTSGKIEETKDTSRFQYFGNMLLRQGGEIGYHGYNHQPLCLDNVVYEEDLPYNTWESYESMKNVFAALIDFGKRMYPTAELAVYVPPSNIMSPEGRAMLAEEFPEITTISGLYFPGENVYTQEFEVAADGIVEQPRIISGCQIDDYMMMAAVSELNLHFVNNHFMHPDDLLDEDRGAADGWEKNKQALGTYMGWLYGAAPLIRNLTGSEASGAIQRFGAVTVQKEVTADRILLEFGNFYDEAQLFVRINEGSPGPVTGGRLEHLTGDLYLLRAEAKRVTIERRP